jgi:c-di-GMP-binding flagellar brake protein YcgR
MNHANDPQADFSRYFALKQRAYLINISEERDREQYESLSGIIVDRSGDSIALQIPYATEQEFSENGTQQTTYKLTSESMGGGIQMIADLVSVTADNIFHLRLRGNLEMYQRRQTPRVDTTLKLFQLRRDASLSVYRKEFRRILNYVKTQGLPPGLKLQETSINLSAGGMCIAIETTESISPLSMIFIELDDGQPPVCTVAEMVWNRHEEGKRMSGHRFVQIRKADQERINRYVLSLQKDLGINASAPKINWELLDRMTSDGAERKS